MRRVAGGAAARAVEGRPARRGRRSRRCSRSPAASSCSRRSAIVLARHRSAAAARSPRSSGYPAVGTLTNALPGGERRQHALQGHPAERLHARRSDGARDDGRVHRSPVPVLPAVRDPGDAGHRQELRAHREAQGRGARARLHRPRLEPRPQGADRRGVAEQGVQLRRAPLLQPGHGEHRLAERRDGRPGRRRASPASAFTRC